MRLPVPECPIAIVALPVEVDMANADRVYGLLDAAAGPGIRVLVADCTATMFCDAAGVRCLVKVRARAAARGTQLRLVIAPGGLLRRVLELLGVDDFLPVYSSVGEASMLRVASARDPLSGSGPGQPESIR